MTRLQGCFVQVIPSGEVAYPTLFFFGSVPPRYHMRYVSPSRTTESAPISPPSQAVQQTDGVLMTGLPGCFVQLIPSGEVAHPTLFLFGSVPPRNHMRYVSPSRTTES